MGFIWWTLIGLVLGAGGYFFFEWAKKKEIKLRWYEITLLALGFFTILLTIDGYIGNVQEFETKAAGMTIVFMGIPAMVLIEGAIGLIFRISSSDTPVTNKLDA